jgi:macrolide-specific efflux system membrane fusion protein
MKRFVAAMIAGWAVLGGWQTSQGQLEGLATSDIRVQSCLFTSLDEPILSAGKAGILISVAREGEMFRAEDVLAQIDDRESTLGVEVAQYEFENAMEQARNDVDIRYAAAQKDLAEEELQEAREAVALVPKAFSNSEIRQRELNLKRSVLAEEQARRDHLIARTTAKGADAKLRAAKLDLELRKVRSTVDGVTSEVMRQAGEWVNPGDPIAKVLRLNRLRFEGYVSAKDWRPDDLRGKKVTIEVQLPGGQVEKLESTITAVSYDIATNNEFRVWGEVDNPEQAGGGYLIAPGMSAGMIVHMR